MNCKEVQDLILTDFIDGEASQYIRNSVLSHLDSCKHCAAEYRLIQLAVGPLSNTKRQPIPQNIWYSVNSAISEKRSFDWFGFQPAAAAAFALLLILLSLPVILINEPEQMNFTKTVKPEIAETTDNSENEEYFEYAFNGYDKSDMDFESVIEESFL